MAAVPRSGTEERNAAIPLRMTVLWCGGDGGKHVAKRRSIAGVRMTPANCAQASCTILVCSETTKNSQVTQNERWVGCRRWWKARGQAPLDRWRHVTRNLIAMGLAAAGFCSLAHAAPQGGAISWVSWEDPNEQAFTIEVPKGWTIKGGASASAIRTCGHGGHDLAGRQDSRCASAMWRFRPYAVPTPGHPAGDRVDLGAQAQMTSARYHTGQEFATRYAQTHFIRVCQKLDPQPSEGTPPVVDNDGQSRRRRAFHGRPGYVQVRQCRAGRASPTPTHARTPVRVSGP